MKILLLLMLLTIKDDGRYAASPLKEWFDSLASRKGPCCSDADGSVVADADWRSKNGHYQVYLEGAWIDVQDDAVVTKPNLYGKTMVWPLIKRYGDEVVSIEIRCFMLGGMI